MRERHEINLGTFVTALLASTFACGGLGARTGPRALRELVDATGVEKFDRGMAMVHSTEGEYYALVISSYARCNHSVIRHRV